MRDVADAPRDRREKGPGKRIRQKNIEQNKKDIGRQKGNAVIDDDFLSFVYARRSFLAQYPG